MRPLNVFQVGNHEPPHSTENHLRQALEHNGHTVYPFNERPENWAEAASTFRRFHAEQSFDLLLWTSTSGYAPRETFQDQQAMLVAAFEQNVPTVSYHLDLWFGLKREHEVREKPFFRTDLICTADGGHQDEWFRMGKTHFWFPPAIVESEVRLGEARDRYAADICFVGSWQNYGHRESRHRFELVSHLHDAWGDRVRFWPEPGQPRIDGRELADLYASTKVVVGDSCMVPHLKRYISDRVPNVLGRGALLLHPFVGGVTDGTVVTAGEHLGCWEAGDWRDLDDLIEFHLADADARLSVARQGMAHVLETMTYEVRMKQLVTLLTQKGML